MLPGGKKKKAKNPTTNTQQTCLGFLFFFPPHIFFSNILGSIVKFIQMLSSQCFLAVLLLNTEGIAPLQIQKGDTSFSTAGILHVTQITTPLHAFFIIII